MIGHWTRSSAARAPALWARLSFVLATVLTCGEGSVTPTNPPGGDPATLALEPAFLNLRFDDPVDLDPVPGSSRLAVAEAGGRIKVFDYDLQVEGVNDYLDLSDRLVGAWSGLIAAGFHNDFATNGWVFVYYAAGGRTFLERYSATGPDATSVDPATRLLVLEVAQPDSSNNGGALAFDPNGYLYLGLGDGGPSGDPNQHGQDLTTLLGSVVRLDVSNASPAQPYQIPPDNPFADGHGPKREEIWAWGLQNPQAMSFDTATGVFLIADASTGGSEEVNRAQGGANFGWSILEANSCYNPPTGCDATQFLAPVWSYGTPSLPGQILGGGIYSGIRNPDLRGSYIFADGATGEIWTVRHATALAPTATQLLRSSTPVTLAAIDPFGELLLALADGTIVTVSSSRP